jgi:hypothetical protein
MELTEELHKLFPFIHLFVHHMTSERTLKFEKINTNISFYDDEKCMLSQTLLEYEFTEDEVSRTDMYGREEECI